MTSILDAVTVRLNSMDRTIQLEGEARGQQRAEQVALNTSMAARMTVIEETNSALQSTLITANETIAAQAARIDVLVAALTELGVDSGI